MGAEVKKVRKAILPAAGLGTRFLPATKASPKEMLPIVDKPLIQYAVEEAASCGIGQFILITGKNKRAIEDHFDKVFELDEALTRSGKEALLESVNRLMELDFAFIRQREPRGLGDAVACARNFAGDEPVAVLLSDDVIPPGDGLLGRMIGLYEELGSPVVALERVDPADVSRYGVVAGEPVEGREGVYRLTDLVEKPAPEDAPSNLAIIGRYVLTPDIFRALERIKPGRGGEVQLTDAIRALLAERDVYGLVHTGVRYDAGSKLGFLKATVDFALANEGLGKEFKEFLLSRVRQLEE